jgi:AAA+ superfamily predicted ATPase
LDTLDHYLSKEHPIDQRDIDEIENCLEKVVPLFIEQEWFDDVKAWPYEIKLVVNSGESQIERSYNSNLSLNTTAMILNSLLRLSGKFKSEQSNKIGNISKANIFPRPSDPSDSNKNELEHRIKQASRLVLKEILDDSNAKLVLSSKTFGDNNVFSLAWLAEVSTAEWKEIDSTQLESWKLAQNLAFVQAEKKLEKSELSTVLDLFDPGESSEPLPHAFPALRLVQIIRHIKGKEYGPLSNYYGYFETLLHQQLSFSSIPDSRFDPAELMFCLEGMLLCQRNIVDRTLFDRVLDVLTSRQLESPYWRPVKPYMATPQGLVLFPVSVEIANSLLRACAIFDRDEIYNTYSSKCIVLLRRYWQWLRARAVKFKDKEEYLGWHSEHVNSPKVIHLWETSQVIEFLLAYRNALYLHIAHTVLTASRFTHKKFEHNKEEWKTKEQKFEPVTSLGENLRTYQKIDEDFVKPHSKRDPKNFSMLLYGPPGTGKTTVAESIAEVLGYRLITITVSDFLAVGGAQVEARAKNIFDALKTQPSSVILFDEIDHFLLDRDSERYGKQDTVFQFMTPGMLTKLNELRRTKHTLFIVATNYEDRIDAAIKRTGRIDKKYLILPPDADKRKSILTELLTRKTEKLIAKNIQDKDNSAPPKKGDEAKQEIDKIVAARIKRINNAGWRALQKQSLFLGYKDLEAVVNSIKDENWTPTDLSVRLKDQARTTSLEAYKSRFVDDKNQAFNIRETPMEEFLCLIALSLEVCKPLELKQKPVVRHVAKILNENLESSKIDADLIKTYATKLDSKNAERVAKALSVIEPA